MNDKRTDLCMPMVRRCGLSLAAILISSIGPASWGAEAYTLDDCFQLALKRSEALSIQSELIDQAEARTLQARAAFLPTLGFGYAFVKQEMPTSSLAKSLFPADQRTAKSMAGQSLFRGFRDFAALKQKRLERGAAESARDQAKQRLFEDTTSAFYDVLAYEADLSNYRSEIEANEERRRDLLSLRKLARARDADIVAVESSIAALESEAAAGQGLLDSALETLAFLTGLPPESGLADSEPPGNALEPMEKWLANLEKKPEVSAARQGLEATEQQQKAAQGGYLPSADAGFNYYFERPGINSAARWDAQLGISVPIFSGGLVRAQVSEAASRRREKELALGLIRRQAEREIHSLHKTLSAALDRLRKLEKLADLSRRAYELRLKDSRAGLSTNVDVLQALAAAHQARRSRDHARLGAKQQRVLLELISARRELP